METKAAKVPFAEVSVLALALILTLVFMVSGCGLVVGSSEPKAGPAPEVAGVARAKCGPGSNEETGLQGQVPKADRDSGRSLMPYSCNLEPVGQWQGQGASWQFAWYDTCGYYDQKSPNDLLEEPGTVVVDAKDSAHPVASDHLQTPAMIDPWESLKVNEQRALLGAVNGTNGAGGPEFDFYDVKKDCAHPVLLATASFPGTYGHEGNWSPDGLTYWGSGSAQAATLGTARPDVAVNPVDVSDPTAPVLLLNWNAQHGSPAGVHGLSISEDGNRGYFANLTNNGLLIVDTSQIQSRKASPTMSVVGEVTWSDGAVMQHTVPFTSKGKKYVLFTDEGGFGAARIIDISNEAAPTIVSKLKLEIHLPENASAAAADGAYGLIQYDGHYCSVDRPIDPTVVGCGYAWSGIRVFDIRDVAAPKEIAYYNPGAKTEELPGSQTPMADRADKCTAQVRFIPERGELWTTCQNNGFLALKFTNGAWPFKD